VTAVQIMPGGEGGAFVATVAGITLPIDSYVAEPGTDGRLIVSLAVFADSLQIGVPPRRTDLEQTRRLEQPRNQPPVSTWGDPSKPDPRANIPGWQPPPARADAGRGQTGEYPPVASHRRQQ
jgi:hypothetical protein